MSGLLSAVIRALPFVNGGVDGEEHDDSAPLLSRDTSMRNTVENESSGKTSHRPANLKQSTRRFSSHLGLRALADEFLDHSKPTSMSSATTLRVQRPEGRRSVSSSIVESRLPSNGTNTLETPIQRDIMARLSHIRNIDASRRVIQQHNSSTDARIEGDRRNVSRWHPLTHSNSDPYLRGTSTMPKRSNLKPLKTCLKKKSKSADTTPTNETMTLSSRLQEDQKLRRRKTVDFAEASLETDAAWADASDNALGPPFPRMGKDRKQRSLCPGTDMLSKRSLANPAVTRTDVHVIAITPSPSRFISLPRAQSRKPELDPATPTMQIIESSNGTYEVIWDDVPSDPSVNTRRRSSAAGEALGALSTSSKGLERVNSKLTEWSGTWNTPSDGFKPTIVVFPDDDGLAPQFDCAITHYEDVQVHAPPNSERTSAVASRHASRPASVHMSRAPSQDETRTISFTPDVESIPPDHRSPFAPDPDAWPAHRLAARRKPATPSSDRKLSNIEEADVRFRDHRDSVTLAHSRLINSGGVSPELFTHRDSVTIAKKRMYARNHTTSTLRQLHRLNTTSEPGFLPTGDAAAIPAPMDMKAYALEALRKEALPPILRISDYTGEQKIPIID